jgi:hypothetical protein
MDDRTLTLLAVAAGLVGASTGVASLLVSLWLAVRDEARVKVRLLRTPPTFWDDQDQLFVHVEIMNVGKRRSVIYAPEMLVVDLAGFLWYQDPSDWLPHPGEWSKFSTDPYLKIELQEHDSVSFFFPVREDSVPLYVEVYDTFYRRRVAQIARFAWFRKAWSLIRHFRSRRLKREIEDVMLSCYAKPRRRR